MRDLKILMSVSDWWKSKERFKDFNVGIRLVEGQVKSKERFKDLSANIRTPSKNSYVTIYCILQNISSSFKWQIFSTGIPIRQGGLIVARKTSLTDQQMEISTVLALLTMYSICLFYVYADVVTKRDWCPVTCWKTPPRMERPARCTTRQSAETQGWMTSAYCRIRAEVFQSFKRTDNHFSTQNCHNSAVQTEVFPDTLQHIWLYKFLLYSIYHD